MDATAYPNVFEVIGFGLLTGILRRTDQRPADHEVLGRTLHRDAGHDVHRARRGLLISNGETFPNLVGKAELGNTGFPILGTGTVLGVPVAVILMVIVALAAAYVAGRTPLGRQIYAIGGNERASLLSGVYVNRVKIIVYVVSGACAAIVGLIISSQLVASHPASGTSFEMNAIAAAVLGGTSLAGGRGTIGGTIIGAFVIGVLSDGLVMMGVSEFWQMVIKGLVIIAAVVLDQMQRKMEARKARRFDMLAGQS
jgi:erythritol transport system permease protein